MFHPGAYGLAKKRHQQPPSAASQPGGDSGTFLSPRDEHGVQTLLKSVQVGEDAYFLRVDSLGIADGVGGWTSRRRSRRKVMTEGDDDVPADDGYADPGMFARLLMGFCEDSLAGYWERRDEEWLIKDGEESEVEADAAEGNSELDGSSPLASTQKETWKTSDGAATEPGATGSSPSTTQWADRARSRALSTSSSSPNPTSRRRKLCPVEIMQRGYERCMSCVRSEGIDGSSTALLAILQDDELRIANLGDCACVVVRKGEIVFRTEEMQHAFNFPMQLGTNSRDEPMKDAEVFTVKVERDDIVVMSSDGLVDNLFDEDILDVLAGFAPPSSTSPSPAPNPEDTSRSSSPAASLPPFSPQKVSEALVHAAHTASEETGTASPFMCRAIEEGIDFMGGKRDDISVLVAVVQDGTAATTKPSSTS